MAAAAFGSVASRRAPERRAPCQRSRSGISVAASVNTVAAATPPITAAASPPAKPIAEPGAETGAREREVREAEDDEEPGALKAAPDRRDDECRRDRRGRGDGGARVAAAGESQTSSADPADDEDPERPGDEASHRVPQRGAGIRATTLVESDRDLARNRRLERQRWNSRDQGHDDERDEQRVLRRIEDPRQGDLEDRVQSVGDDHRDPDEETRAEQRPGGRLNAAAPVPR